MNRLNKAGLEALEYKKEYIKDYSAIIINSLAVSLDQMVKADIVDRNIVDLIKNKDINVEEFEKVLLESERYSKTDEEIKEEMEESLNSFKEMLVERDLTEFEIITSVEEESYIFISKSNIDVDFIKEFFGLTDEELSTVMDKKGFAEKFAALRMNKVMKDIVSKLTKDGIQGLSHSASYFNADGDGFDIDLIKKIKASELLKSLDTYVDELEDIQNELVKEFDKKMQI